MEDREESIQWLTYAQGYLKTARLLCQNLESPKFKWSDKNPRVPSDWCAIKYKYFEVLPALLYAVNHGIELSIKENLICLGKKIPTGKNGHDLKMLFSLTTVR